MSARFIYRKDLRKTRQRCWWFNESRSRCRRKATVRETLIAAGVKIDKAAYCPKHYREHMKSVLKHGAIVVHLGGKGKKIAD